MKTRPQYGVIQLPTANAANATTVKRLRAIMAWIRTENEKRSERKAAA